MTAAPHNEPLPFQSVLVFGMGMMGASLALALRESEGFTGRVSGVVRSEKSAAALREMNIADEVYRLEGTSASDSAGWPHGLPDPSHFDLIVIGLPVRGAVEILERLKDFQGIVTDMSSTGAVARQARDMIGFRFVGSHPMCGSENSGPTAARSGLFQHRLCMIMDRDTDPDAGGEWAADRDLVERLWRTVGMQVFRVHPDRHDEIVAYLSHGPHLISGLLTLWAKSSATVDDSMRRSPLPITGGGFKDMARIAGSNPEMWYDILDTNRGPIADSLRRFRAELDGLIQNLEEGRGDEADRERWYEWFTAARRGRNFLCRYEKE